MPTTPNLNEDLLRGRRALEDRPSIKLLEDWRWHASLEKWGLQLQIEISELSTISTLTDWFILADASYPFGDIDVYPSNTAFGITTTFPHQEYNGVVPGQPFRSGKICLSDPIASLGRGTALSEPFTADERFLWHVDRLTLWIRAADLGDLQIRGEHFELPHFPSTSPTVLGFNETGDSFGYWDSVAATHGPASVVWVNATSVVVTEYREFGSKFSYQPDWGRAIASKQASHAIWLRLPKIPLVQDWRVPTTWGELSEVSEKLGVSLYRSLESLSKRIRDGKQHLLLIGFPIPAAFGFPANQLHWQAIGLPILSHGTKTIPGFRPKAQGFWRRDREILFEAGQRLQWFPSSNWSNPSIRARGGLIDNVANGSTVIIGCGSLGSSIAELLVRLGTCRVHLIDGDKIYAPNLSRHTLSLDDLGKNKAESLAQRLNLINPFATATSTPLNLSIARPFTSELGQADLVIDCTGSDAVLQVLSTIQFNEPKTYFSFSMARGATKLYAYHSRSKSFPLNDFHQATQPTLKAEADLLTDEDLHWESAGCWHPLFPARLDDIWILASAAVKWMESQVADETSIFEVLAPPKGIPVPGKAAQ